MKGGWTQGCRSVAGWCLPLFLFVTPFSKSAIEILFPVLLVTWLLGWVFPWNAYGPRIPKPMRTILLFLLAYLAVCALSISWSNFPMLSLRGLIRKNLEYALLFVLATDLIGHPSVPNRSYRALIAAGWLVLLYGLIQEWTITTALYKSQAVDPIRGRPLDYIRMVGPYENPNDLATFLMVVGLVAIASWIDATQRGRGRYQLVLIALLLGCLVWSRSIGALLGLVGGVALLARVYHAQRSLSLGMAVIVAAPLLFFLFLSWPHLREVLTLSDIASQDRMTMWKTAWAMIQGHPLLGLGLNTFMANYASYSIAPHHNPAYAHNCFLQIAAETGLLGFSVFVLFLLGITRLWWRLLGGMPHSTPGESATLRPILAGLVAASVAFLIQSMFDTNLYALRQAVLFWTISGMATGLSVRLLQTTS